MIFLFVFEPLRFCVGEEVEGSNNEYTPEDERIEPENDGLVQMIFRISIG